MELENLAGVATLLITFFVLGVIMIQISGSAKWLKLFAFGFFLYVLLPGVISIILIFLLFAFALAFPQALPSKAS